MQDESEQPHLPGIDASRANDESLLRVHAQMRRQRIEGSPIAFFTAMTLIVVLVFAWFYARRYFAELDSTSVLESRDLSAAYVKYLEGGITPPPPEEINGAELYAQQCMACHQTDGSGVPGAFPPLVGSTWVTGEPDVPIKILLAGLSGPIEVNGQTYNGAMPAFGPIWDDARIAAVVTHIRSSWDNGASEVTPEQVAEIRAEIGSRGTWTAQELQP